MQTGSIDQITAEIDSAHARSKAAFRAKDIDGYMSIFATNLSYKQANGKVISYAKLKGDVASQLATMHKMESTFTRDTIEAVGSDVVETLTQTAILEIKVFFVFRRRWQVHRRGRYVWSNTNTGWAISSVEVIEEQVS